MSGWNRVETAWWPAIADALAKPWPREACLMDLRFHADQARFHGQSDISIPETGDIAETRRSVMDGA